MWVCFAGRRGSSIISVCRFICLSVGLCVCLLSSNLSTCLPIKLSLCLSLSLLYQSIYLSACICLLIYLPVYLSTHVSVMPFIFISIQLHEGNTFTYFSNCLFVHLSIFIYIHLTIIIAKACRRATLVYQTTLSFSRERMCHVLLINYSFSCSLPESKPHTICSTVPDNPPTTPNQPGHTTTLACTTDQASRPAQVLLRALHARVLCSSRVVFGCRTFLAWRPVTNFISTQGRLTQRVRAHQHHYQQLQHRP